MCGLTLISSPHLARSYHHLFPVAPYREVPPQEVEALAAARAGCHGSSAAGAGSSGSSEVPYPLYCHACLRDLSPGAGSGVGGAGAAAAVPMVLQCEGCGCLYCYECDAYVHESLHNCPGCECRGQQAVVSRGAHDGAVAGQGDGMDVDGAG